MRQFISIIILQTFLLSVKADGFTDKLQEPVIADTNIIADPVEAEIIAEVIKTKAPPKKKKYNISARLPGMVLKICLPNTIITLRCLTRYR